MSRWPRATLRGHRIRLVLLLASCAFLLSGRLTARQATVTAFLDRYAAGDFEAVVRDLSGDLNFGDLLDQLKRGGPAWIDAAGPEARERRELVAVTFALEAARADQWFQWKWIWKPPAMVIQGLGGTYRYQPPNVLYWPPAPLFIEWACERWRRDETPRPLERWWQLAALAVAQRSEDGHFLVGDPKIGLGFELGEIGNLKAEIKHLDHVADRFKGEPRFMLAQGIARDQRGPVDALQAANALSAYDAVNSDVDVGGEADMRAGALFLRLGKVDAALTLLNRAETLTRDPYVVYLARFFKGQALDRKGDRDEATDAYRAAVRAWPHAQAATMLLASRLFESGRRAEAQELTGAMLAAKPWPVDPWRAYVHADDRFWPILVGRLRAEIRK